MQTHRTRKTRRARRTAAALAVACLALTGCGADDIADKVTEKAIENAAGEDADVDVDTDSGEIRVETSEGTFSTGRELPDSFPVDAVPLLEGELVQAVSVDEGGSEGFAVHLLRDDQPLAAAVAEAVELLEGAGFEVDEDSSNPTMFEMTSLASADHRVIVSGHDQGEETMVQYMVFPQEAG